MITKSQVLIDKFNEVFNSDCEDRLSQLYDIIQDLSFIMISGMFDLDYEEKRFLSNEVSGNALIKIMESSEKIYALKPYLRSLIYKAFKDNYQANRLVYVDDLENIPRNAIKYDIISLIDLKQSINKSFKDSQTILNFIPYTNKEKRIILKRLILLAAASSESMLNILDPVTKQFALSFCTRIKVIFRINKKLGLLMSRETL